MCVLPGFFCLIVRTGRDWVSSLSSFHSSSVFYNDIQTIYKSFKKSQILIVVLSLIHHVNIFDDGSVEFYKFSAIVQMHHCVRSLTFLLTGYFTVTCYLSSRHTACNITYSQWVCERCFHTKNGDSKS